jgi:hypothetical protein
VSRRSTPPNRCDHKGSAMVEQVKGGYTMRCIICRKVGPVRTTPEAACKALLVLGVRDGSWARRTGLISWAMNCLVDRSYG